MNGLRQTYIRIVFFSVQGSVTEFMEGYRLLTERLVFRACGYAPSLDLHFLRQVCILDSNLFTVVSRPVLRDVVILSSASTSSVSRMETVMFI